MLEDNLSRWRPDRSGFYEIWYLKLNHLLTGAALWVRYGIVAPRDGSVAPWGELWGIFFDPDDPAANRAGLERFDVPAIRTGGEAIVRIGGASLGAGRATGRLVAGGTELEWDLRFAENPTTFHHVPGYLRALGILPTQVCTPNVDLAVHGSFRVGGRSFELGGDPGQQGHIWGRRLGHRWTWAHCNSFAGAAGAVFEGITAQVRVGPFVSPPLTSMFFRLDGVDLTLNSPGFMVRTRSDHGLAFWRFVADHRDRRFVGELSARLEDIVVVGYTDTDLSKVYCHNTKLGSMRLLVQERSGRSHETRRALESHRCVALEYVDRTVHPSMRVSVP